MMGAIVPTRRISMDWAQQMEQMSKQWAETQRAFWSTWAGAMPRPESTPDSTQWRQMIDAWRTSVRQMLEMQSEGVRLWAEGVKASSAGAPAEQWAGQLQQMTNQWIAHQRQMWDGWFQLLENAGPQGAMRANPFDPQSVTRFWQETAQQAMNSQQQWLQFWNAWQPGKKV
jgi:hypothetical protein